MANANVVDSFSNLCSSYIDLADRFQQLDVEHMTLKSKVIPLLKALKNYQKAIATLQAEKQSLQATLDTSQAEYSLLIEKYESLKALEPLLDEDMMALMQSAEEQSILVKETTAEMDANQDPDLSDEEKSMLDLFYADPEAFAAAHADQQPSIPNSFNPQDFNSSVAPDPALV